MCVSLSYNSPNVSLSVYKVNKNMPALFSIKEIMTSSHHPQINGQVKATNRIVKAAVYKSCNANQDDWDE